MKTTHTPKKKGYTLTLGPDTVRWLESYQAQYNARHPELPATPADIIRAVLILGIRSVTPFDGQPTKPTHAGE